MDQAVWVGGGGSHETIGHNLIVVIINCIISIISICTIIYRRHVVG